MPPSATQNTETNGKVHRRLTLEAALWAKADELRGKAAHGEFDQFTRADVEQMLQGLNNFLAEYR
jgi:hypothetical protein